MEKIKKILDENKSLKILIPVLFIAIIIVAVIYLGPKKQTDVVLDTPSVNITATTEPTTMPGETSTDFSSGTDKQVNQANPEDTSLIGPPEYKGAMRDSNGAIALLQFTNITKRVKIGDSIAGYKIKAIADDDSNITLEKDTLVTVLQISPNSN